MSLFSLKSALNSNTNPNEFVLSDELIRKLHVFLLDMLEDIVKVLEKHHLRYFVGGGSCLGAIRHKGFIPWDDDLDINMPREDYDKFASVFETELGDKYELNAPNYSSEVISRFPKVLAKNTRYAAAAWNTKPQFEKVFIDIFTMENVPDNKISRFFKGCFVNFLEFVAGQVLLYDSFRHNDSSIVKKKIGKLNYGVRYLIGLLFSLRGYSKWCNCIDKSIRYENNKSFYVCFPTGRKHYFGEILPRSIFFPLKSVPFENSSVLVPCQFHNYLKNLYGENYMELPPPEKREKHFVSIIDLPQANN